MASWPTIPLRVGNPSSSRLHASPTMPSTTTSIASGCGSVRKRQTCRRIMAQTAFSGLSRTDACQRKPANTTTSFAGTARRRKSPRRDTETREWEPLPRSTWRPPTRRRGKTARASAKGQGWSFATRMASTAGTARPGEPTCGWAARRRKRFGGSASRRSVYTRWRWGRRLLATTSTSLVFSRRMSSDGGRSSTAQSGVAHV